MNVTDQPQTHAINYPRPNLQRSNLLREIGETLVLIIVVYTLVNLATVRFYIEGPSMQPTFWAGQFLIVSRLSYMIDEPHRGDIVVFDPPGDNSPEPLLIKRLIGLPGETVELRGGLVYINNVPLQEDYILEPCTSRCADASWTLSENEFFFMGDNRNNSRDSRAFGQVSRESIIGEAVVRYFPLPDISIFTGYQYPNPIE